MVFSILLWSEQLFFAQVASNHVDQLVVPTPSSGSNIGSKIKDLCLLDTQSKYEYFNNKIMGNSQTNFKENRVLSIDMGMVKYHCIRSKIGRIGFKRKMQTLDGKLSLPFLERFLPKEPSTSFVLNFTSSSHKGAGETLLQTKIDGCF